MSATTQLRPGDTIGILGGGQLGRMMALAGASLGLKSHIYCPDPNSPAFEVANAYSVAPYDDVAALDAFASQCQAITYEFENVPGPTADHLNARVAVRPGVKALEVAQDRLAEKEFLRSAGVEIADFARIDSEADLTAALEAFAGQGVLKTRRFGYDGKGQVMIRAEGDADGALDSLKNAPAVLERLIGFQREVSVIVGRDVKGTCEVYDIAENLHENHILKTSTVPANVSAATAAVARDVAVKIASALDYVGVLGVELFLCGEGSAERLLVNEIAPRVHNSGHWTQDACLTSQFEQHMRAVAGWQLGSAVRHSDVVMENLIGDECENWAKILSEPNARLHLYGKAEARPGRKMGHVNRIFPKS
ncbi:5-(carboxyamino)imidazole ribonucleotide synthase [Roseibium sp. CAU 1637]|uniref:N5-carboxyaminoimidazole ribonucleotide synthase n=1 Tax=Roseibium limicola TaxID=2816037 RepID=A0A939J888_9HYPH|nr:5-(carboxyamino)imidazole ribonucleotide synthase [Roseibium limicola]MBO0346957.1 5-(carboxyamino)imidazole ribonucleotide synthase [Roseibium limicola]